MEALHSDTATSPASTAPGPARHNCYLCSRSYERHDHLSRHLKSHDNERAYRCPDCGKGFNRADLLNRHRAAHSKTTTGAAEVFRKRTPRACEACIKAKTKCDDERPCKRCKTRGVACQETEARDATKQERAGSQSEINGSSISTETQLATPVSSARQIDFNDDASLAPVGMTGLTPLQMTQNIFPGDITMTDYDFFESIMMPEVANPGMHGQVMMPPDVSDFTQDLNIDAFDFDFSFLSSGLTRPPSPQAGIENISGTGQVTLTPQSDAHLRSEAFKKSPWSWNHWIPQRNQGVFSGQDEINVQEDGINATDQHISPSVKRSTHCELNHEARDRMIRVVTQVASSKLAMPSFPSLQLLEDLIDVFLLQHSNAIDSFVHSPTFSSRDSRTELLLAAVASGSRYIALEQVWKMGLIVQEVVRLALAEVFEADNSTTRDLQPLQAYMLWLGVGVWSGFRRKTELAASFLQPAMTMLTWSHSFQKFRYSDYVPSATDSDEVLEKKWKSWLDQEGRKRLVMHTFLHDSQVAIAHMQNRLISPAQMMLPPPAARDLWLAPNAHAWRNLYLTKQPPPQSALPSVMETFSNLSVLDSLTGLVDKPLCTLVACHALAHEVWQFRQQSQLLANWQNEGRRDRWLTHLNRQRDLFDDLMALHTICEVQQDYVQPQILFTIEYLIMSLHVSLEDIQAFSGKSGEDEARKVYPRVRAWTEDAESRRAVCHAGQVLRIAQTFEKTGLRDFYAVALYQATLTLWVYGMVTSNTTRRSGDKTPVTNGPAPTSIGGLEAIGHGSRVFLDDEDDETAKSFRLLGQGVPGLRNPARSEITAETWNFCSLHDSRGLMLLAQDILKRNFPESRNGLPPLVENLANLMNELGRLSGK